MPRTQRKCEITNVVVIKLLYKTKLLVIYFRNLFPVNQLNIITSFYYENISFSGDSSAFVRAKAMIVVRNDQNHFVKILNAVHAFRVKHKSCRV